jgi:hypothetical protein
MENRGSSIESDVASFVREAAEDYIGLWQIVGAARDKTNKPDEVITGVLDIVRALLDRGLLAGNLKKEGGFEPWAQQQPDAVLSRIQEEWRALGHDPTIDDIAWFDLPR